MRRTDAVTEIPLTILVISSPVLSMAHGNPRARRAERATH
jgi:hypothetical protein|eukprot:COSAG01_NODE_4075_length_5381_cov_2.647103_6_plen_40_part_00